MIHVLVNSWLYYRLLDLPEYRYVRHERDWLGRQVVVFTRYRRQGS